MSTSQVQNLKVAIPLQLIILFLFMCTAALADSLYDVLVQNGLKEFAEFTRKYPSPLFDLPQFTIFAPTDEAVRHYYKSVEHTSPSSRLARRQNGEKEHQSHNSNQGTSGMARIEIIEEEEGGSRRKLARDVRARTLYFDEMLITTGLNKSSVGGKKVISPPGTNKDSHLNLQARHHYKAEVAAGAAEISRVYKANIEFDRGLIHITDSFFTFAQSFAKAFETKELSYIKSIYARVPGFLDLILSAPRVTLLIPQKSAFDALGELSDADVREIVYYLVLVNGFLGHTPTFQDGKTYRSKGGDVFVVSKRGKDVFINDARIIKRNYIFSNGVAQILDKFPTRPPPGAKHAKGPNGELVKISHHTSEKDFDL
ncbi:hypothetical protein DFH27DRAFT_604670 [Peziza echinospora]|nr:hypothetical protein DFH27DRAFT_604670 [Peziza echinospora]